MEDANDQARSPRRKLNASSDNGGEARGSLQSLSGSPRGLTKIQQTQQRKKQQAAHMVIHGKRSFQSQEEGGVWGGGIWKFKLRQSSVDPPLFLHQSTPNVPIRINVKKKQASKLKFLK